MDKDYTIAMHNLTNSSKKVGEIHASVSELLSEMRGKSIDFYYRLSILSGGVLSLSITYIGYLASIPNRQIHLAEFLFLAWIFLLIAVFSSIYRNHFNLDMGHYQVINVLNNARLEEFKASLIVLENYPQQFVNLKTKEDVEKQIKVTKGNISTIEKAIKEVKKKEGRESSRWLASQKAAHISFLLGMIFVTLFAALNLPVSIDFTLFRLIISKIIR